jgi:LysM repeat protein
MARQGLGNFRFIQRRKADKTMTLTKLHGGFLMTRRLSMQTVGLLLLVLMLIGVGFVFAQDSTYTIEYGDVLDVIAAGFDVDVDCLAESSGIDDPNQIRPGDTLVIRADCPPYTGLAFVASPREEARADAELGQGGGSSSASGDVTYTVRSGDVLDLIAAAYDVDVTCLALANGLPDPNRINKGDELTISPDCPPYSGEAFVPNPRTGARADAELGQGGGGSGDNEYIVQTGDVLDLIAAAYDVSVACTAEASGLADANHIRPGDVIVIDLSCPAYDGEAVVPNPRGASSG